MSSPGRRLPGRSDLATYAPIGDGRTVALIAADGGIDWMPMPNLDSTPVFARLVDDDHGGCIELHVVEDGLLAGAARCRAPRRAGRRPRPRSEDLGAYTMFPGSAALDTSVLLPAESGFDRGERMSRTIDALTAELGGGREALPYRYSGMRREEHTFVASAFWRAGALACVGRHDEAIAAMDELVGHANDVGIYSEMISDRDGSFWGNLPQALSHLAVVTAALTIRDVVPEARLADH